MRNIENHIMKGDMNIIKHKIICDNCKGNGYIRLENKVFQCWICNSEGEIYEKNTNRSVRDVDSKQLH